MIPPVRILVGEDTDVMRLRGRLASARIDTGVLSVSRSAHPILNVSYHLDPDDHNRLAIDMDLGSEPSPTVERWRKDGFGREPIVVVADALAGALAHGAAEQLPEDVLLAVTGMASSFVGETENAEVVVRLPTPISKAHVMIGRPRPGGNPNVFAYDVHRPEDTRARALLDALPLGTFLRTDEWTTTIHFVEIPYQPGELDPVTRLRTLAAWASWKG